MFCLNCGTQLEDGLKFCTQCGARLGGETAAQTPSPQAAYTPPAEPAPKKTGAKGKTVVLVCNIIGLNFVSRFITGHVGTGLLVLLLDIFSLATLSIGIGWIGIIAGIVIWIIDLIKVGTDKWQTYDGEYLTEW
jgi:hypothetical protein